jgi:hypothetical protein
VRKLSPVVSFVVIVLSIVPPFALSAGSRAVAAPAVRSHAQRPRSGWIARQTKSAQILYIANTTNETVTMYDAATNKSDPPVVGVILDGITNPTAMAVDGAGNLYVANARTGSQPANVEMYANGTIDPAATYTQSIMTPVGVATDKRGDLFVANATPTQNLAGTTIAVFAPGSTAPTSVLDDINANAAHALLADAAGDTYLAYSGYLCCPAPAIDEFFPKHANPLPLGIAEPIEGNAPAPVLGLALDDAGNMIIADGTQIGVYAPSAQPWPTVAPPIATIAIGRPQSALALNQANTRLFGLNAAQNQVIAYNYPAGTFANVYMQGVEAPAAIAVSPSAPNPVPSQRPAAPHPPKTPAKAVVYIATQSDNLNSQINELTQLGKPHTKFTITVGVSKPTNLAVDPSRNLYAANLAQNDISVYAYNQLVPEETLSNGLSAPTGVAVGGDGTIAVPSASTGEIVVYPQGNTTSPTMVQAPGALGVALDTSDDVYYTDGASVYELPLTGSAYGAPATLFGGVRAAPVSESLVLDGAGNLIAPVPTNDGIGVFPPGATAPLYVIGSGLLSQPWYFALDESQHFLYVVDAHTEGMYIFRYPDGTPLQPPSGGAGSSPGGLAIAPAAGTGPPWALRQNATQLRSSRR